MSVKAYFVISGSIFGLAGLAHLLRVVCQMPVHAGDWPLPMWLSRGGFAASRRLMHMGVLASAALDTAAGTY